MSNIATSTQFIRLLDKRLKQVEEDHFPTLPSNIPTFFNMQTSDSAWEEYLNIGGVPDIPSFTGYLEILATSPGFLTRIEPAEFAGGLQFEKKLMDDKKYPVFEGRAKKLIESAARTKDKDAMDVFNYCTSTAFQYMYSEEGVALVSDSHTNKSGASTSSGFDNSGTTALSRTSVAATRLLMRRFRNDDGERIDMGDNFWIICPDALTDTAEEIVGTIKGLDTANGNINPQYGRHKVVSVLRLDDDDTNNWGMVQPELMKESLLWVDRIKPETNTWYDPWTFLTMHSVYMRYGYGWKDWRWIYWHTVS